VRKDLKEYWKAIVGTMMDGLVVVDNDGIIVNVNKALENITGYGGDELVGKSCTILDCDGCFVVSSLGHKEKNCPLFTSGEVVKRRCELRRKDGTAFHVLKNATVLKNDKGKIIGGVETLTDITDLVKKEKAIEELQQLLLTGEAFEGIIGNATSLHTVKELIRNAAASDAPVIIYGESGTGKELVANAIHRLGKRCREPFIKVSCAALNESLLESELFGHVKGAFTGAGRDRIGRFEAAHKGDIFLDEIGDVSLSTQVKLLRVLQEKEIERVGDQTPISIDVRIIAATHRDLEQMCSKGRFRDDLYYRLNVIPIHLPPLRDRREDISLLVNHFLKILRIRSEKQIDGVSEQAMQKLIDYAWPGNVRELANVLEYAFVVCHDEMIASQHLPRTLIQDKPAHPATGHAGRKEAAPQPGEREELLKILETTGGNRQEAAHLLGISRVTLWKLLKKHGITAKMMFTQQTP
jgi:two-component system, NtrC family, response regulator HydG